ncbi:sulfite oxidase [Emericellopsis cladophorae]|uniref:Sulfite oxidase n=1 Tax=Emericellopsis cladophorae TaxID=2686198 RepID=A0A9Q0BHF3_9HYPO|nr:sulfite oxidase [Emericellopsis cladophorae]KAI6784685.1 sulfite oxidase [Emericellopsis cladophorae]
MLHLFQFPCNAKPAKRPITEDSIRPNSLHFVWNHGGIPIIDKEYYSFQLDGLVASPQSCTLVDLKDEFRFPRIEKTVAMQCSGTRHIEQILKHPGQGEEVPKAPWGEAAIGCAQYVGISLKKPMKACDAFVDGAKHLKFYGADIYLKDNKPMNYVGSTCRAPTANPLRIMVFGYISARCLKWLYKIKAIKTPSRATAQSQGYL